MKKALLIGSGVLLVALAALLGALSLIDLNAYKADISAYVSETTGRAFRIDGDLGWTLSSTLELHAEGVHLANAPWGSQPEMVSARRVEFGVALLPLIGGRLRITHLALSAPRVYLETNDEGSGNWELPAVETETPSAPEAGTGPPFHIEQVSIEKARLEYHDGRSGETHALSVDRLRLQDRPPGETALTLELRYADVPIRISGTLGALGLLLEDRSLPVDLSGRAGDIAFGARGRVTHPLGDPELALALRVEAPGLETAAALAGTPLPPVGGISLETELSATDRDYRLSELSLRADKSDLTGELVLSLEGPRPKLNARLSSTRIDLSPYLSGPPPTQPGPGRSRTADQARLIPDTELPVGLLHGLDAELQWDIRALETANASYRDVRLGVRLEDGRLEIRPVAARFAKGETLAAQATVDTRGRHATLALRARIEGLELGQLKPLKGVISSGPTQVSLTLRARGDRLRSVIATLDGRLLVQVGKGRIVNRKLELLGSDLVLSLIRTLDPWSKTTAHSEMECAVAHIEIKKGVATWDKGIALETDRVMVISSGSVALNTEKLDIGIHPEAREGLGLDAREITGLVRIGGTLAQPRLTTSTEGTVKLGATVGAAVATGGLSYLVQGLYRSQTRDPHPCRTALGSGKGARPRSTSGTGSAEGGVDRAIKGVGEGLKGIGRGVKGLFK